MTFRQKWKKMHWGWDLAAFLFVAVGLFAALLPMLPTLAATSVISLFIPSSAAAVAAFFTSTMSAIFIAAGLAAGLIAVISHLLHVSKQGAVSPPSGKVLDARYEPTTSNSAAIHQQLSAAVGARQQHVAQPQSGEDGVGAGKSKEELKQPAVVAQSKVDENWANTGKSREELKQLIIAKIFRDSRGAVKLDPREIVLQDRKGDFLKVTFTNIREREAVRACKHFMQKLQAEPPKSIDGVNSFFTTITCSFTENVFLGLVNFLAQEEAGLASKVRPDALNATTIASQATIAAQANFAGSGKDAKALEREIAQAICNSRAGRQNKLGKLSNLNIRLKHLDNLGKILIISEPKGNRGLEMALQLFVAEMGGVAVENIGSVDLPDFLKKFPPPPAAVASSSSTSTVRSGGFSYSAGSVTRMPSAASSRSAVGGHSIPDVFTNNRSNVVPTGGLSGGYRVR
jgi:hypothetical protein